jgi:hypothetical protein
VTFGRSLKFLGIIRAISSVYLDGDRHRVSCAKNGRHTDKLLDFIVTKQMHKDKPLLHPWPCCWLLLSRSSETPSQNGRHASASKRDFTRSFHTLLNMWTRKRCMSNPAGSSIFVAITGNHACCLGTRWSSKGAAINELKVDLIVLNWSVAWHRLTICVLHLENNLNQQATT